MMIVMKLLVALTLLAAAPTTIHLRDVRSVYVFPMGAGYDQYLASELTVDHVFQVVADPKSADAFFTDRLGPAFEQMLDEKVLEVKPKNDQPHSSFGSGKGTLFLVSKSKQILWSAIEPPKNTTSKELAKSARKSVEQLKIDLAPPGTLPAN